MEKQFFIPRKHLGILLGMLIFLGLYLTSLYNYLLFHTFAEIFSIVIAFAIFVLTWNSRQFLANHYFLFLGIAFLFAGVLDLLHTLAYKGMGVFQGYDANLPTQLWIAFRYFQSLSLLIAPFFITRRIKPNLLFIICAAAVAFLLLSIFHWKIFPTCFIEGIGLTPLKKISEYIISLIFLVSVAYLLKKKNHFDRNVLQWLVWSIVFAIACELAFTFYVSVYGFSNLIGHYFEILSFYLIYKAIVEMGLSKPYHLLFRDLKQSEEALQNALKESKQREKEIAALLEGSQAVLNYRDFKGSAQSIFNSCKNLIGASAGYISLLSKDGKENEVAFLESGGLPCTVDPNLPMPIRGLREVAYRTGKTIFHNNFSKSEYMEFMPEGHAPLDNALFAPLTISGKVIGLLGIANKPGGFNENDARMASAFGELAAIALYNSRTLESLETDEERFRSVVQTASDAIVSVDSRGNIIFWNNSAETIFGYSSDEVIGKPLTLIIPERLREDHQKAMNQAISTGQSKMIGQTAEMSGLKKGGLEFPVELSLATWQIEQGTFFTGIIRDITERKRMEEELRKSRDKLEIRVQERTAELSKAYQTLKDQSKILEAFFSSTVTPLVLLDRNFNFVRVNEAYAKACQRDISEFPGHNHFEFYPSKAKPVFEQVVETKIPYQAVARPFTFPDHPEWGTSYWDWTLTPILDDRGGVEFLVFSLEDVTKRKRAEDAVKAERQRFNDVLEMLPAYLVLLSPDYHVPFANRFFRERFGESHGQRCFEYLFGRSEPCEICETYTVLKTNAPHHWEWTGPDGRNYDVFDFPFTDTDGTTLILEIGIDITERKQAQGELKAASLYTRSLIEASLDPLVTISADGKIMDVNSATELTTGVPRDELIGTDFSDYFTEPEKAREGYQRVFQDGFVRDYPLAIRHTSGKVTDVLYHATVFRNEVGETQGVFAAARDITARKRVEKALQESESRLRLLSSQLINVQEAERKRIAREIHDSIGQTLAAIKFALENKLSQMGGGAVPPGVSIENIIALTQNGIEESRRIQMDLRPSVLDDLGILATIGWFTREFQKVYSHISVEKQISVEENEIPDSLRTVLFRVMQEAMNNVAKHSKADLVHLSLRKMEGSIELIVDDNGAGFDLENIKQGLGLTSMRERTELSGGSFAVESIPGKGTTIKAQWPI